ncbi:hypothetical protein B0T14DRAFT_517049 [Immersiella caudata]|uniref:Uncharacterized protein n=1 Tax=Immersiella caudata TaxID=314043 RepID=A0AA39WY47_9PEZI|nr:hypothetical protein B0T14DRAFT_517049 [Immersiella caudata]
MSVTTGPVLATLSGTPVIMYPVPTPWPFSAGCDTYVYRQVVSGLILAYDPIYPSIIETEARSCFRTEVSSWWFQSNGANPSTALGPTFVCPESYSAVHSTLLGSDSAAETHYTYCCPPSYTLGAIYPPTIRSVAQCTSTVPVGGTVSYKTSSSGNSAVPTSTVVTGSAATANAPAVNGYNIVQRQVSGSSSSTAGSTGGSSTQTPPPGGSESADAKNVTNKSDKTSTGTIAGAVVGGVLVLLALLAAILFWFRRRRQRSTASEGDQVRPELADKNSTVGIARDGEKAYYAGAVQTQELAQESYSHELGSYGQADQRFELPAQDSPHPPGMRRGG